MQICKHAICIILHNLNLDNVICQFYLNKTGEGEVALSSLDSTVLSHVATVAVMESTHVDA